MCAGLFPMSAWFHLRFCEHGIGDGEVSDKFSLLIKSQKGRQVLWMEIKSSFKGDRRLMVVREERNVRYYFVVKTGKEEDGNFGDRGKVAVGGPDLVAEEGKVFRWWDDTDVVSKVETTIGQNLRWYQLPHAQESILKHQPNQFRIVLVLGYKLYAHCPT